MLWWPIIENLESYLKSLPELAGINIHAGAENPISLYPCIEILWDRENQSISQPRKSKTCIWIDCWVNNSDPDPAVAYRELYSLQSIIYDKLPGWQPVVGNALQKTLIVDYRENVSDGDSKRPVCGARMIVKIEWRK